MRSHGVMKECKEVLPLITSQIWWSQCATSWAGFEERLSLQLKAKRSASLWLCAVCVLRYVRMCALPYLRRTI